MAGGGAAAGFGAWRGAAQFANPAAMAALPALHGVGAGPAMPQYPPQYAGYAVGAQSFAGPGGPGAAGYGYGFGSMGPGFMAVPFANQMPSPFGASVGSLNDVVRQGFNPAAGLIPPQAWMPTVEQVAREHWALARNAANWIQLPLNVWTGFLWQLGKFDLPSDWDNQPVSTLDLAEVPLTLVYDLQTKTVAFRQTGPVNPADGLRAWGRPEPRRSLELEDRAPRGTVTASAPWAPGSWRSRSPIRCRRPSARRSAV